MVTLRLGSVGCNGVSAQALASWLARLRGSRPLQAVAILGLLTFVAVIVGTVLLIHELRVRQTSEARRNLMNLNAVLAEGAGRALQGVDLVLRSVADEIRAKGVTNAEQFRREYGVPAAREALKSKLSGLPQIRRLTLLGPDGQVVSSSLASPVPPSDLVAPEQFAAMRRAPGSEVYVSGPVRERGSERDTVYVARRLTDATGDLMGIAHAALDLDYFRGFLGSLSLRPDGSISLSRRDGRLILVHPERSIGPGESVAVANLEQGSPAPFLKVGAGFGEEAHWVAQRALPDFPIIVTTSRTVGGVLGDWRSQAIAFGVAGALVAAAVVALMGALWQQFAAYEVVGRAVRDKAAAVQGRAEAEAQLRQSQKLEAMGQLTSGVAHDFNNLLTVVIGNLDMLARRLPPDQPRLQHYLEGARGGAERAAALTKRLLAFSRRQALEPREFDVNELVRGMSDLLRQTLGENIELRLDLGSGPHRVFADPNGLDAALLNLVVNARDAMPGGGVVTVETRTVEATDPDGQSHVAIKVADTGHGMPPDVVRRAFEPFFTTKAPGVGTGLGLAQVYGFVEQSVGEVEIDSVEGEGTRITMRLPRIVTSDAASPPAAAAGESAAARGSDGELILVVDDHPDVRSTSADTLESEGYATRQAADGASALRVIEQEPVALVIADIGLPGMDGRELGDAARRIRPNLRVLYMTGHSPHGLRRTRPLEPGTPVLLKPFSTETLLAGVAQVLEAGGKRG